MFPAKKTTVGVQSILLTVVNLTFSILFRFLVSIFLVSKAV